MTATGDGAEDEDEDGAPPWPPPLLPPFARGGGLPMEEEEDRASCKRADRRREGSDLPLVEVVLVGGSGSMVSL